MRVFIITITSLRKFLLSRSCNISLQATSSKGLHTISISTVFERGTVVLVQFIDMLYSASIDLMTVT